MIQGSIYSRIKA